ncbi:unnamed protein product [Eruca vesicaria subsp. sativa]|uniref:t-SNARE coiled-coil homology domain-containing protein n=1 Tax=Eruca vesicaria subsp. sativa TaxID=29727 RepID=A0ABC8JEV8_ERUVS|nr:unnamed protein product [Eruca vesicaria subsp. sativa]
MNDLLKGSLELPRGESSRQGDVELGEQGGDQGLEVFFEKVQDIDKQYEKLDKLLKKLQASHEESKAVTKAPAMKDKEQRPHCEYSHSSVRQVLRENIQQEYREVVDRCIFTVTGQRADEDTIDELIETGNSEQISRKLFRSKDEDRYVMDTLAEIQERHDAVRDLEKKLLDLQQIFMDMAVLVDAQGEMLDNIESQVSNLVDHVQSGNTALQRAKSLQKSSRKWMCIAIIILLIVVAVIVVGVLKPWQNKNA